MSKYHNLWSDLASGPNVPWILHVVVEIPKGSRNKYEYDEHLGIFKLDRVLYSPLHYPGDYGFVPQTKAEDGDALDALVMVNEPTFSGCVIQARPIGVCRIVDRGVHDNKILAVPATDPIFAEYQDLADVPRHYLAEVAHFFRTYKDLEGFGVDALGWEPAQEAREEVLRAMPHAHTFSCPYTNCVNTSMASESDRRGNVMAPVRPSPRPRR